MFRDALVRSLFNESTSTLIAEQLRTTPRPPVVVSDFKLNDIQRHFIIDKDFSFYSMIVDATPIVAGLVLILIILIELICLIDTCVRYESYIMSEEEDFYREIVSRQNSEQQQPRNSSNNINSNSNTTIFNRSMQNGHANMAMSLEETNFSNHDVIIF